jgi:succinyl-diaminopimelate desuccinylase
VLIRLLARLQDAGAGRRLPEFQPSNLEVVTVDVGNPGDQRHPAEARARLNIRFNPAHRGADLAAWIERVRAATRAFAGRVGCAPVIKREAS